MNADNLREGLVFRMEYADASAQDTLSSSEDMHFRVDGGALLYPDVAISLWDRMIELPPAGQMRCHNPRYGIQLNFDDGRYFIAAICWECNNISISSSGEYTWQTFDGQSDAAQSLLADIRGYVPESDV